MALLDGEFEDTVPAYCIIDCRYAYEYAGGHINGALNTSSLEELEALLFPETDPAARQPRGGSVLVLHCEFSCKRAPKL